VMDMGHSFQTVEFIPAIPVAEACSGRDAGTAPVTRPDGWQGWLVIAGALHGDVAH